MMKILSIDYNSINSQGGIATFNKNMRRIFSHDIKFLSVYKSISGEYSEDSINYSSKFIPKLFNYVLGYRLTAFLVARKVKSYKADLIIVNSPTLARYLVNRNYKLALVQHQDFDVMLNNRSNFGTGQYFLNDILKKIDFFVALSPLDLEKIRNSLDEHNKNKVVSIRHMSKLFGSIRLKNREFDKRIVMIGRLDNKQKRYDLAIQAMKKLPEWSLTIFGDGEDELMLKALVDKLSLTNVIFAGYTNNVSSTFSNFDVYILTSDFEGYPITAIEALCCGMPIILRNTFESASDMILDNGVILNSEWSEAEYIQGLKTVELNHELYANNSIRLSSRYSYSEISKSWNKLICNVSGPSC